MKRVSSPALAVCIGSEAVAHFDARGWQVIGFDNNMRADSSVPKANSTWNSPAAGEHKERSLLNVDIRPRAVR